MTDQVTKGIIVKGELMEENKRIAWKSTGGDLTTSGQVTFKALPQDAVEVTVTLSYVPPAGVAGEVLTALFGDPEGRLTEDLLNFKAYMEGMQERLPPTR